MDALTFSRFAYPPALLLVAGLAVALPAIRLWRRTGIWAITGLRNRDPEERTVQGRAGRFVPWIGRWS